MIVLVDKNGYTIYGTNYYEVNDLLNSDLQTLSFKKRDELKDCLNLDLYLIKNISFEEAILLDESKAVFEKLSSTNNYLYYERVQKIERCI